MITDGMDDCKWRINRKISKDLSQIFEIENPQMLMNGINERIAEKVYLNLTY